MRLEDLGVISLGKLCVSVALCQCGSVAGVAVVAVWQVWAGVAGGKNPSGISFDPERAPQMCGHCSIG